MIQAYSVGTSQIDSAKAAVADILSQLSAINLLKNSVGIMVCHHDYVSSGVAEAVGKALPFDTVGYTTFYQATRHLSGLYEMTITILTSDDVYFATGAAESELQPVQMDTSPIAPIAEAAYRSARKTCNADPSLIFSFYPHPYFFMGDLYLRTIDELSGGAPHFGAAAAGNTDAGAESNGSEIFTFINGKAMVCGIAMLLCVGEIDVRFFYGSYSEGNLLELSGTVTKAQGIVVHAIDGHPAMDFFKRAGFVFTEEAKLGLPTVPVLHRRDKADPPIARALAEYTPEGSVAFTGEVPEGSQLRVGAVSMEDLLSVTRQTIRDAMSMEKKPGLVLAFSCIVRYMTLGLDSEAEIQCITPEIPKGVEYMISYAFGELCPVVASGTLLNRFHNNSFVVCTLS